MNTNEIIILVQYAIAALMLALFTSISYNWISFTLSLIGIRELSKSIDFLLKKGTTQLRIGAATGLIATILNIISFLGESFFDFLGIKSIQLTFMGWIRI
jgi:hypothetical protein